MNPELFLRVGINPPKGCLLYGPPGKTLTNLYSDFFTAVFLGVLECNLFEWVSSSCSSTGKTLLARAMASKLDANFLKVVSSAIVEKFSGESARLISGEL